MRGLEECGVLGKLFNQPCCAQFGQFGGFEVEPGGGAEPWGETSVAPLHPQESDRFRLVEEEKS